MGHQAMHGLAAGAHFRHALLQARHGETPFRHWSLHDALPARLADAVVALPFAPPPVADTAGRRETNNATRLFVSEANRARYPACAALAEAFQDEATTALIGDMCDTDLTGCFLRIEYCQDQGGFWLEPHTDIGAKRFTMLIYLSQHADAETWGTDLLDATHTLVARAQASFNAGLIFIPGPTTWHGFSPRPITGTRRSLIVNYVTQDWRSRHELAYPDAPVA